MFFTQAGLPFLTTNGSLYVKALRYSLHHCQNNFLLYIIARIFRFVKGDDEIVLEKMQNDFIFQSFGNYTPNAYFLYQ